MGGSLDFGLVVWGPGEIYNFLDKISAGYTLLCVLLYFYWQVFYNRKSDKLTYLHIYISDNFINMNTRAQKEGKKNGGFNLGT